MTARQGSSSRSDTVQYYTSPQPKQPSNLKTPPESSESSPSPRDARRTADKALIRNDDGVPKRTIPPSVISLEHPQIHIGHLNMKLPQSWRSRAHGFPFYTRLDHTLLLSLSPFQMHCVFHVQEASPRSEALYMCCRSPSGASKVQTDAGRSASEWLTGLDKQSSGGGKNALPRATAVHKWLGGICRGLQPVSRPLSDSLVRHERQFEAHFMLCCSLCNSFGGP